MPFGPAGTKITVVHAEHSSELTWKNPATGKDEFHVGGEPVGFIVEMENRFRLWHTGDPSVFGDMPEGRVLMQGPGRCAAAFSSDRDPVVSSRTWPRDRPAHGR